MRYFIFSDVHGAYDALIKGLEEAGYDANNPEHQLVSGGDNFGRSDFSVDNCGSLLVYKFLTSSEHVNKPLCIKGNHELIFLDMCKRQDYDYTDAYNGEVKTLASFVGLLPAEQIYGGPRYSFEQAIIKEVALWMSGLPFYVDIGTEFRVVHGWHPKVSTTGKFRGDIDRVSYPVWKSCTWAHTESEIVRFMEIYPNGWKKTLIFGHWHARQLRERWFDGNPNEDAIWYDRTHKLIGIDPCSYISKKVNVLVIEDERVLNNSLN